MKVGIYSASVIVERAAHTARHSGDVVFRNVDRSFAVEWRKAYFRRDATEGRSMWTDAVIKPEIAGGGAGAPTPVERLERFHDAVERLIADDARKAEPDEPEASEATHRLQTVVGVARPKSP